MTETVHFPELGKVILGNFMREGNSRACFECSYSIDGKEYVVKVATSARGRINNLFEYMIYQHAKNTELSEYYPDFRGIAEGGKYLLVERCITAYKYHDSEEDEDDTALYLTAEDLFPDFMLQDMTDSNWGYTITDERPVILDMGWDETSLSSTAAEVGMSQEKIASILHEADKETQCYGP